MGPTKERSTRLWILFFATCAMVMCAGVTLVSTAAGDFGDYPGYTCVTRDTGPVPGMPLERTGNGTPRGPNIEWWMEAELFPVGMKCVYRTEDEPLIEVATHSSWVYTVFFYGFLCAAFAFAAWFVLILTRRLAGHKEIIDRVPFPHADSWR